MTKQPMAIIACKEPKRVALALVGTSVGNLAAFARGSIEKACC